MASGRINGSVSQRPDSYSYYIDWSEDSINVEENSSIVRAWVHIYCSKHTAYQNNCSQNLYINGVHFSNTLNINLSPGVDVQLLYGETKVYHEADGTKRINISANGTLPYGSGWGPNSGSASGDVTLDTIPRYAEFNENAIDSVELESVDVAYNSNKNLVAAEYSLNGGVWQSLNVISGNWSSGNNRVVYRVSNLNANTDYRIETRIANVSGLWRYGGQLSFKTKDYIRIGSVNSIEFGENVNLTFSNLQNGIGKLAVKIGDTEICTRENLTANYTLIFSKKELSKIVSLLKEETTQITYIVYTNNKYTHSITSTIILKSCIFIKVDGNWRKAKLYKKDNNLWKLCRLYIKKSGSWRSTI